MTAAEALLWCQRCKKWCRPDELQHVTIKREHRWPHGAGEFYLCWACLEVLRSVCPDCAGMAENAKKPAPDLSAEAPRSRAGLAARSAWGKSAATR